jgi:hypothetical protein
MTASTFIARILGPLLVVIGIGLLVEGGSFAAIAGDFVQNGALIYLSGLISLAVGLAILNVHHIWEWDWAVVITIFGWLALIGGIFRILATSLVQRMADTVIANPRLLIVGGAATLVLGGFLTAMGYREVWSEAPRPRKRRTSAAKRASTTSRTAKRPRRKPTVKRASS